MNKAIKYLFFTVAIYLIILSIYILYGNSKKSHLTAAEKDNEKVMSATLKIGVANFDTINPIKTKSIDIQYINKLIFNSLVSLTQDFKLENELAEEIAKIDNKTYIIKLKKNVKWHNGEILNSKDVIYTIEKIRENENSIYYNNVKDIIEVISLDSNTIKIKLAKQIDFFEYLLSFPIIKQGEYENDILNGTGKYRIKEIRNKQILLEKVEESVSKIKEIIIVLYDKNIELYNEFSTGNIDFMYSSNINYEEYLGKIGYSINASEGRTLTYLAINNENEILKSKEVRQAIKYSINTKKLIYEAYNNKYEVSRIPINQNNYLYYCNSDKNSDQAKAKQVLLESGWKYNSNKLMKNRQEINLSIIIEKDNGRHFLTAKEIKENLEEIGMKIEIIEVNRQAYNNYIKNKDYQLLIADTSIGISPNLSLYFGEDNIFNFKNKKIEDLMKEVKNIEEDELLKEKYKEIIKIYEEEVPFISLHFNSNIIIYSEKLIGNLAHNWFNLYYNIGNWYVEK